MTTQKGKSANIYKSDTCGLLAEGEELRFEPYLQSQSIMQFASRCFSDIYEVINIIKNLRNYLDITKIGCNFGCKF